MVLRRGYFPKIDYPLLYVVRAAGASFFVGVEEHTLEGVRVRVTGVARTVADCFKYRSRVGPDVALEVLYDSLCKRKATLTEINGCARACRVEKVMRPYLEAMAVRRCEGRI
ncbi:MAG: hypothetical protein SFU56_19375 [Capsulimonadales bacterium]|nr:hypothetical protein [Capsulimonadales bacterium]